jgi:ubiquinone/menaquinone biosynthesis C-methylase UbiE
MLAATGWVVDEEADMPDVYATIDEADEALQRQLADVLDLRAADQRQRAMLDEYLARLALPSQARVLEIGSGTGAVARTIARLAPVAEVVGVDPSPVFVKRAQAASDDEPGVSFVVGDGRELPFDDGSFDAVVCHTSLCHIPGPDRVLAEAARVVRSDGWLAVFDGDYTTTTVATSDTDPLQACADVAMETLVHDRYLVRKLPRLASDAGWNVVGVHLAEALKSDARRRVDEGRFFGHIAYASVIARRS